MSITNLGNELFNLIYRQLDHDDRFLVAESDFTVAEVLEEHFEVLGVGQACNRLIDTGHHRVWLARTGLADGEPFENTVYLEELDDEEGRWNDIGYFDGDEIFWELAPRK